MNSKLKQLIDLAQKLQSTFEERVGRMKDSDILQRKLSSVYEHLIKASDVNFVTLLGSSKQAFIDTLTDLQELLERVDYQTNKFQTANAIKQKIMESDVRHKLRELAFNISTLDRVIDSVFLQKLNEDSRCSPSNNQQ